MKLERLTISLRNEYVAAGPSNPYQAKLDVGYNENRMSIALSDETCRRILALAGDEIARAAQIQIADFVQTAISVSQAPAIEGTTE